MKRETASLKLPIGAALPKFSLPATDGRTINDGWLREAAAGLVVFTCNHCPYVKGSEQQLIAIVRRFESQGLRAVAINSNDASQYPEDSFQEMQKKSSTMNLPYPYLYDEAQVVARSFDAACTPEAYLFDQSAKLVYHGAITDNPRDPNADRADYLGAAIAQLLAGRKVDPSYQHPIGCSIKWK